MFVGPLRLKLQFTCGDGYALGPDKADLLDAIAAHGSISAAGRAMDELSPRLAASRRDEPLFSGCAGRYPERRRPRAGRAAYRCGAIGARRVSRTEGQRRRRQAFVDGYTTYSASLRYTTALLARRVTFQLNADNLTDKRYWSAAGNNLLGVGLPRQIKFTTRLAL